MYVGERPSGTICATLPINQIRTEQIERESLLLYEAVDPNDERRRFLDVLRGRIARGEWIGVLLPKTAQVHSFANLCREYDIDAEVRTGGWRRKPASFDFDNLVSKFLTYHSAKGLTFDTVMLPRLVSKAFARYSDSLLRRLLFLGITRAVKWVYLSTVDGQVLPTVGRIKALAENGVVTVQTHSLVEPAPEPEGAARGAGAFDDLTSLL